MTPDGPDTALLTRTSWFKCDGTVPDALVESEVSDNVLTGSTTGDRCITLGLRLDAKGAAPAQVSIPITITATPN
jgi:hypothetical protein